MLMLLWLIIYGIQSCDKSSYIRSVYSQCHVNLLCTGQNVTQFSLYVHIFICLKVIRSWLNLLNPLQELRSVVTRPWRVSHWPVWSLTLEGFHIDQCGHSSLEGFTLTSVVIYTWRVSHWRVVSHPWRVSHWPGYFKALCLTGTNIEH